MTVVVGYLMSDEGRAALDQAVEEAKLRDARLVVVHALHGGPRDEEPQRRAYRDELERVEAALEGEPLTYELRELVRARPAGADLVAVAREEAAALLVVGVQRRNPVGKPVLASSAVEVLLHAHCPVLAVTAG